jgi:hypothetical protein
MIRSLYRLLLRLYPASFRAEYAEEMAWAFDRQLSRTRGPFGGIALFSRVALDLVLSAAQERVTQKEAAMQPIEGGTSSVAVRPEFRASHRWRVVALSPLWVSVPLLLITGNFELLYTKPPDILGIPAAFVFEVVGVAWMALGAAAIWQTRFPIIAAIAITFFALPSLALLVLGPIFLRGMMYPGFN